MRAAFWTAGIAFLDYPSEVLSEAWEKIGAMPANLVEFFPALVETLNIAAASTLVGTIAWNVSGADVDARHGALARR